MERFKSKNLLIALGTILTVIVMAFVAFWASEQIVVNKNAELLDSTAVKINTINGNFKLEGIDIIRQASQVLGKSYAGGQNSNQSGKGYNGNIWTESYNRNKLYTANQIGNVGLNNGAGLDCSGLVYWTLSWLDVKTTGFGKNKPVPVDTADWFSYSNPTVQVGSNAVQGVNILKESETITPSYRYYNYDNGKKLPMGTIVVAKNTNKSGACHAWITIGDLGTTNVAEAIEKLRAMGISDELLTTNNVRSMSETCTYWRIEATSGNVGQVLIDNGDPNSGDVQNGKPVGTIYAFQIANDVVIGKYNLSVNKYDNNYKSLAISDINTVFSVKRKIDGNIGNKLTASSSSSNGLRFGDFTIDQQSENSIESFIIEEENPPKAGYERYNKEIEIQIKKERVGSSYNISVDKVFIDGNLDNGVFIKEGNTTLKSYDNDNVRIDCLNNQIIVAVKNKKVDLALKKMIQRVYEKQEDSSYIDKEVTIANGFNTDRISGFKIDVSPLNAGETNALYTECKHPVQVKTGDKVRYDIRIYNEGEVPAKANVIKDYIPVGLKVLGVYVSSDTNMENNLIGKNSGNRAEYQESNGVLTITLDEEDLIAQFDGSLFSQTVWVVCEVKEDATGILTNVAEISEYKTENGIIAQDIDSTADNWNNPNTGNHNDNVTTDKSTSAWCNYANAQQDMVNKNIWLPVYAQDNGRKGDDDDFDKLDVLRNSKLIIKKVDNESNEISDVNFTIKKRTDNNPIINNQAGSTFELNDLYSSNTNGHIVYTITEEINESYVQARNPMNIDLWIINGQLEKYWFYAESEATENYTDEASHDYYIESNLADARLKVNVEFNKENSEITLKIENIPQTSNQYNVNIKKVSGSNGQTLDGVTFNGTKTIKTNGNIDESSFNTAATVNGVANIASNVVIDKDNYSFIDKYLISEVNIGNSNTGYNTVLTKDFYLMVSKMYDSNTNTFKVREIGLSESGEENTNNFRRTIIINDNGLNYEIKADLDETTNTITIEVPNFPDDVLPLKIVKVDKDTNDIINGTKFTIYTKRANNTFITSWSGIQNGEIMLNHSIDPTATDATYKIIETRAADGYDNVLAGKYILVNIVLNGGNPNSCTYSIRNQSDDSTDVDLNEYVDISINNGVVIITVKNKETSKPVDLALKKVITEVNGIEINTANGFEDIDRLTEGNDKFHIDTTPLDQGKNDALYYLNKTPITVPNGAKIKYELRIYNEGAVDATASEIKDYVPAQLRVLNVYYKGIPLTNGVDYEYSQTSPVLKISKLSNLISAYVPASGGEEGQLSYDVIEVECEAFSSGNDGIATNIAEITEYKIEEGIIDSDRDSEPDNFVNPVRDTVTAPSLIDTLHPRWVDYYTNKIINGVFNNYPGQQDDDDFEKVIVVDVDLVLKKIITQVGDTNINDMDAKYTRFQNGMVVTNTEYLDWGGHTTADYLLNKTPVQVSVDDSITYEIRIYNEGDIDATAKSIKDYIPKGLTFDSVYYNGVQLTTTDYSIENNVLEINVLDRKNLIPAYQKDGDIKYDSVLVKCRVTGETRGLLTNVAEISKYKTIYGETEIDRDSQTNGNGEWKAPEGSNKSTVDGKSGDAWANYYESSNYNVGRFLNYPGQQDDDDFEKIYITNAYNLRLIKLDSKNYDGISGTKFTINNEEYITDELGNTAKTPWTELKDIHSLDTYTITEIETKEGYVKLANPIFLGIRSYEKASDGIVDLDGYYINFLEQRVDSAEYINYRNNGKIKCFETVDELNRPVNVWVEIYESQEELGNYEIEITIENKLKDSLYQVYINKINSFGENIEGVKFVVNAKLSDQELEDQEIITTNTTTCIATSEILASSADRLDVYEISEIETLDKYILLPNKLRLEVIKGLSEDNKAEIKNMKLYYGAKSASGTEAVVIQDVPIGTNGQTIDISAEIRDITSVNGSKAQAIVLTIPNEPVLKFYSLRIKKVNKVTGEVLEGATFEYGITGSEEMYETEETDSTGIAYIVFDEIIESANTTTYNIKEGKIPQNYLPYQGNIILNVVTKLEDEVYVLDQENTNVEGENVTLDIINNEITLTVPDEPTGAYSINVKKVSKENGTPLVGAKFAIKEVESTQRPVETDSTNEEGIANLLDSVEMNSAKVDSYIITETAVPEKYRLYDGEIKLDVAIKLENGQYVIDEENTKVIGKNVSIDVKNSIITITVSDPEKEFDLSLRKFITKVNQEELTGEESREPVVDLGTLINGEPSKNGEKTATYTHTKEPKLVCPTDIVEYTLRVYNEGELDGYAGQIIDDIPAGVQMVAPIYDEDGKSANLNAQYRWVMYREMTNNDINNAEEIEEVPYAVNDIIRYADKYYVPTLDPDKAVIIATDFLSKEVGEQDLAEGKLNPNLLYAFNGTRLDYADIKVEFIVRPSKDDKTIITNYAQISEHEYKDGTPVTDRDSTPNVWKEGEDDQDVEHLKVKWFDLALYKWVSTAIVTEDGKTKEYPTEHTQDYKEKLVNVTVAKEKLDQTVVKFKYIIKVENQGTLPGYAKELKDYIPAGLKFIEEDNTEYGWELGKDGVIVTNYFENTLLNPTDTVEIPVVLTWINGENNLGLKVNYAEISKDYNEYGDTPDIDSTPDNFKDTPVEDDEDEDEVMLNIKTGQFVNGLIAVIGLYFVVIVATGIWGVKRIVLNNK